MAQKEQKTAVVLTQTRYATDVLQRFGGEVMGAWMRNISFGGIPHKGAEIVAGYLAQAGYRPRRVGLFDPTAEAQARQADLVAISLMDIGQDRGGDVVRGLEGSGIPVMVGGVGVRDGFRREFPEVTIIRGEAEGVLAEALADLARGEMKPDYARTSPFNLRDNASEPYLRKKIWEQLGQFRGKTLKTVEASRGCPWDCDFCTSGGQTVTVKLLEDLEVEIEKTMKGGGIVFFADQNLMNCPVGYLRQLFEFINKRGYKWIGEGTITSLLKAPGGEEVVRLMAKNCLTFLVGVEDLVHPTNGSALKGALVKNGVESLVKTTRDLKLPMLVSLVLANDAQDVDYAYMAAKEVLRLGSTASPHVTTPRPGTRLWDKVVTEGRLTDLRSIMRNMGHHIVYTPAQMTADEGLGGFYLFRKLVFDSRQVGKRFWKNITEVSAQYALGLLVTEMVYALGNRNLARVHPEAKKWADDYEIRLAKGEASEAEEADPIGREGRENREHSRGTVGG